MHLLENDPALSKPTHRQSAGVRPGAGDWFVLIDATDVNDAPAAMARFAGFKPQTVSSGIYRLMFDLAKSDLER